MNVHFIIKKIVCQKENGYTILRGNCPELNNKNLGAVGILPPVYIGEELVITGEMKETKYGITFKIEKGKVVIPQTEKSILLFFKNFVKGVGGKKAKKIYEHFKEDLFEIIKEDYIKLTEVDGIGPILAENIKNCIIKNSFQMELQTFILFMGGSPSLGNEVYKIYAEESIIKIKENPYILSEIKHGGFGISDTFAKQLGFEAKNKTRLEAGILEYLSKNLWTKGNLFEDKNTLLNNMGKYIKIIGKFSETVSLEDFQKAYSSLLEKDKIQEDHKNGNVLVYLTVSKRSENKAIRILTKMIKSEKSAMFNRNEVNEAILEYENNIGQKLAINQKEAVHMVLSEQGQIGILTGGPGTGKTATTNAIIKCAKELNKKINIGLYAPTGRASKRMEELIGMPAMTLHRGLGIFDADNPDTEVKELEHDLIVVDEFSMVDLFLFANFLSAVPENATVLIIGDPEQLPSVGPGLVLRDIIESKAIKTTKLTEIFRQAKNSQITLNAHKIIHGIGYNRTLNGLTFEKTKGDCFMMGGKNPQDIVNLILASIEKLTKSGRYSLDDIQVISPFKIGDIGSYVLNNKIKEKFNPSERCLEIKKGMNVSIGDRVIQLENNVEKNVFNGEMGYITNMSIDGEKWLEIDFNGTIIYYQKSEFSELELSYAISIHKSQGSEFKCLIIPIHSSHKNMLTRNLIYTAITRAKEKVIFIGEVSVLNYAVKNVNNLERKSIIKESLEAIC